MKVSFVGHGSIVVNTAKLFREKGFNLVGFYDKTHKITVDMAITLDCRAYFSLEEIICESDVIFIYEKDENLKNLSYELLKYDLSDKIICVLAKSFMSNEFDMFDTCFTVFPLKDFLEGEIYDLSDTKIIIEGHGKRYYHFIDELKEKKVNCEIADYDKKNAYLLAFEYGTELMSGYISATLGFLEKAGIYDKTFFKKILCENMVNYFKTPKDITYFEKTLSMANIKDVNLHFEALDKFGNINDKAMYKVIAYSIIEHENYSKSEKERIRRIIYKK